jgi:2',3'-cyclic-nucleotide 2'-phosphodiesterase (5'-nucleotidase family)
LTRGEIYELCPFDNLLVIVDVPGDILDTLLQQIASTEGWPVSNGLRMVIKDNKVESATIHNQPIVSSQIYKVAMPDYVANGGDGLKALIPLSRVQTSKLIRDILIEYAQESTRTGKGIGASIDGRITIEK